MANDAHEPLRHISDTALWVAAYRAEESERRDALFDDPFARELAGERGFRLLSSMPKGRQLSWPMVVRTVLLDQMILDRVGQGFDLVLNLAAGLDSRPYRMPLPAGLQWVEVDLPAMIEYKSGILAGHEPVCRLDRIALDLADREARGALLASVADRAERALVITEGLLIYLDEGSVADLADQLAEAGSFRWWATDLASPALLKWMQRSWGKQVGAAGAPFRFAPEKGPDFFAGHGWRTLEAHNSFYAAAKVKRLPFVYSMMARIFPEPKKWRWNPKRIWGGCCLLERKADLTSRAGASAAG